MLKGEKVDVNNNMLALYLDLENLPNSLNIDLLMQALVMDDTSSDKCVFAVKSAFGASENVPKVLKGRLRDNSFHIVDTPHVPQKKNRADLMISIDAFEKLYQNNPPINRFVFVTSDSDFSVIMDRLRAYGKEVWLVCRKADEAKEILAKSCDRMLLIDDFSKKRKTNKQKNENDAHAEQLLEKVFRFIDPDCLPAQFNVFMSKMKQLDPSFDIKATSYKKMSCLVDLFRERNIVKIDFDGNRLPRIEDIQMPEPICLDSEIPF